MIRPKHLFDQAEALFESFALSPEDVLLKQVKSHCILEDCVLAIQMFTLAIREKTVKNNS